MLLSRRPLQGWLEEPELWCSFDFATWWNELIDCQELWSLHIWPDYQIINRYYKRSCLLYVYTHISIYLSIYLSIYIYIYIEIFVCTYIYIYMYIYILHVYSQSNRKNLTTRGTLFYNDSCNSCVTLHRCHLCSVSQAEASSHFLTGIVSWSWKQLKHSYKRPCKLARLGSNCIHTYGISMCIGLRWCLSPEGLMYRLIFPMF